MTISALTLNLIAFVECFWLPSLLRPFNPEEKSYILANLVFVSRYLHYQIYINNCDDEEQKSKLVHAFLCEEYDWCFDCNEVGFSQKLVNICSQRASICKLLINKIYADLAYKNYRSFSHGMFPLLFEGYQSPQDLDSALASHKFSLRMAFKILNILALNKLGVVSDEKIRRIFKVFDLHDILIKDAIDKINKINSLSAGTCTYLHEDRVCDLLKKLFEKVKSGN